jgi:hypothetical protein
MWKVLIVILLTPSAISAQTQDISPVEISGGYSFLGNSEVVDGYGAGWVVAAAWNATRWFGATLEVSGNSQQQDVGLLDVNAGFLSVLGGPRISIPVGRLRPFTHFLVGSTRVDLAVTSMFPVPSTGKIDDVHSALQIGGGADVPIGRGFLVRVAFDYRRVFATQSGNQHRVLTGLVYNLPFMRP